MEPLSQVTCQFDLAVADEESSEFCWREGEAAHQAIVIHPLHLLTAERDEGGGSEGSLHGFCICLRELDAASWNWATKIDGECGRLSSRS